MVKTSTYICNIIVNYLSLLSDKSLLIHAVSCEIRLFNLLKLTGYVMHQQFYILKPTGYVMHQQFNLLNPTGHVMHQQFNIQQLYVLPTLYLCVLYLSENKSDLCHLHHKLIGFYNLDEKFLLSGTNWAFK